MPRNLVITGASGTLLAFVLCVGYYEFWLHKTSVKPPPFEPGPYFDTGIIATNGWEFQITNLFDLGQGSARQLEFCPRTRQVFVSFYDPNSAFLTQWDLDSASRKHTFRVSESPESFHFVVSPNGEYLMVNRSSDTQLLDIKTAVLLRAFPGLGAWCKKAFFSSDSQSLLLQTESSELVIAFGVASAAAVFPTNEVANPWEISCSKVNWPNCGIFYKTAAGLTNFVTREGHNFSVSKKPSVILVSVSPGDLLIWDTETCKEITKIRLSNGGGCCVAYDETKDRFLLADQSGYGSTHLRTLIILRRPRTQDRVNQ